jgi:hypothetical protein
MADLTPTIDANPSGAALSPEAPPAASSAPDQPGGAEQPADQAAAATDHAAAAATDDKSLLEQFDADQAEKAKDVLAPDAAKPDEKPAEAAAPDAKPEGEPPAADAAPAELPPVDYQYELPETLTMSDELKGEVHTAFDEFRRDPATAAQKLIDLHAREMANYADHLAQEQRRVFNQTRKDWRTQVMADVEIGGAGNQTAMAQIAKMRDVAISSAKPGTDKYNQDKAEFDHFLAATGAGDHPAFLRMLHNLANHYAESTAPVSEGIKPPPGHGQNPNARRSVIYDHPRSPGQRQ